MIHQPLAVPPEGLQVQGELRETLSLRERVVRGRCSSSSLHSFRSAHVQAQGADRDADRHGGWVGHERERLVQPRQEVVDPLEPVQQPLEALVLLLPRLVDRVEAVVVVHAGEHGQEAVLHEAAEEAWQIEDDAVPVDDHAADVSPDPCAADRLEWLHIALL